MYSNLVDKKIAMREGFNTELFREVASDIDLELEASVDFWTGTTMKRFYNYFLICTEGWRKLCMRGNNSDIDVLNVFKTFCIYIGKGQGDRALQHLREAINKNINNDKVEKIRQVWKEGGGIIICKFFMDSTSYEASTREAIMIDYIGLEHATNERHGTYYGHVDRWETAKLYNMGAYYTQEGIAEIVRRRPTVFLKTDIV